MLREGAYITISSMESASEMEGIRQTCGFQAGLFVDCKGTGRERAGGLALLWRENINISIIFYSLNFIFGSCIDDETGEKWFLSGIYGHPKEQHKKKTWQLISNLASQANSLWLCFVDLNDTVAEQDKRGGIPRSQSQFSLGRQVIAEAGLVDLGFEGHPFTWTNGRQAGENIQCRLDRAMGNERLINRFNPITVTHRPRFGSDHAPILIQLEAPNQREVRRRKKMFRFEES